VRDRLAALGIMTLQQIERQQSLLRKLDTTNLPGVWGIHLVTCVV